jgi:hypothetical protein
LGPSVAGTERNLAARAERRPDASVAFVANMEDVLEVYQRPHDPQKTIGSDNQLWTCVPYFKAARQNAQRSHKSRIGSNA